MYVLLPHHIGSFTTDETSQNVRITDGSILNGQCTLPHYIWSANAGEKMPLLHISSFFSAALGFISLYVRGRKTATPAWKRKWSFRHSTTVRHISNAKFTKKTNRGFLCETANSLLCVLLHTPITSCADGTGYRLLCTENLKSKSSSFERRRPLVGVRALWGACQEETNISCRHCEECAY